MKNVITLAFILLSSVAASFTAFAGNGRKDPPQNQTVYLPQRAPMTRYDSLYLPHSTHTFEAGLDIMQTLRNRGIGIFARMHNPVAGNALRLKFYASAVNNPAKSPEGGKMVNTDVTTGGALGFEFHHNISQLQFYYGVDGLLESHSTNGSINKVGIPQFAISQSDMSYGLAPTLGLKYFLGKRLAISGEFNLRAVYINTTLTTTHEGVQNTNRKAGTQVAVNPLSALNVGFMF